MGRLQIRADLRTFARISSVRATGTSTHIRSHCLHRFTATLRVSRVCKVRVGIGIRVISVVVTGWGQHFPTWSDWSYMSGSRRV